MRDLADSALRSLEESYRMSPVVSLPELPTCGISLSRWRRDDTAPSHLIEHRVQAYTLSLILRPMAGRAWLGSMPVWAGPIHADTIRLTPPGVDPRWQSDGAFDFLLFTIPTRTVDNLAGEEAVRIHERLHDTRPLYVRDRTALHIGRQMLRACESNAPYAQQFADGLGQALIAHLLNCYADAALKSKQTTLSPFARLRVTRYIAERLGEPLSIGDLAAEVGLSESHFAHAFRASTGLAPHRFITAARLRRAQQLLRDSGKSIGQIVRDCGFKDASHFSRVFRDGTGVTPREYRRSCRAS